MFKTRMHSSRIRTARLLTVSQHALGKGGVYHSMHWAGVCLPRGGVCSGGCLPRVVSAQGGVCPGWCLPTVVSAEGGMSAQGVADHPRGQNDRQV